MTYSEFIGSLGSGITMFYNSLHDIADYFITNYIYMTILGIFMFISLFHLILDVLDVPFSFGKHQSNLDNVNKGSDN